MTMVDLTGKVAVISGAGSGLGLSTAMRLAEQGADLFLHYRTPRPQMDEAVVTLRQSGRRVEVMAADFATDPGLAAQMVQTAIARLGKVDILVNNAAVVLKREALEHYPRELFEEYMTVNVTAVFLALQAAARHMIERGAGGRIINLSSIHSRVTTEDFSGYAAAKGAVNALTYAAAVRLGKHGITVNAVAPGAIQVERSTPLTEAKRALWAEKIPLGRLGVPDDIASLITFLASDEAGYISGEVIVVDGAVTRRFAPV